jgi:hypothetical protein
LRYRIERGKFWAWVVASLLVGALVGGLIGYSLATASTRSQIAKVQQQLAAQVATDAEALKVRLQSAEASITALTQLNSQLTSEQAGAAAGSTAADSGSDTASSTPLAVLSRSITPSTVTTDGAITMTAKVTGQPDAVHMRVLGPGSTATYRTYSLSRVSTSATTETWQRKVEAPSKPGTYHYYAIAAKGSLSVTKAGAAPSRLTVK